MKLFVAGLIVLGVLVASALGRCASVSQRELADAKVKIAGLSSLDSALKEENKLLRDENARADSAHKADVARLHAQVAKLGSKLSGALALARSRGDSTITLPIATVAQADGTLKACVDADNSCDAKIAAEKRLRLNAEGRTAAAESAAETMRRLLPTPNQMRIHDARVATKASLVTVGIIALARAIFVGAR